MLYKTEVDKTRRNVIYKITNLINNKIYVGQTTLLLKQRIIYHQRKSNMVISLAIQKYGKDNFQIEILEQCNDINELNVREEYWIKELKSTDIKIGYNRKLGGNNHKCHEETKKILKEKCSGWKHTPEAIEKIRKSSLGRIGYKFTEEQKEKLIKSHIGLKRSEESKRKQSKSLKGRQITWGNKITQAKIKVTEEEALNYFKENPTSIIKDFNTFFNLTSNGPIRRLGGINKLKWKIKK